MGEEYVILNKDKICFCSHSLTLPAVSALPVADSGKADGVSEAMPPNMVYPIASDSGFSPFKQQYNKKVRPVRLKWLSVHLEFHTPAAIQFSNSPLILAAVMIAKASLQPKFMQKWLLKRR